jgi:ribosomal protein S8
VRWKEIRNFRQGASLLVLNTNKGYMTDSEAIRAREGGFLAFEIKL